jgi:lipoprotein-releasing system permease protein
MFKPLSVYIGLRYVRAKRRNHFISFISLISIMGIALGVWALITVLSVMNGFEKELRERILGMASHATIEGIYEPLENWQIVADAAGRHARVKGAAPYIEGEAMLSNGRISKGILVRGIIPDQEKTVSEVGTKMVSGDLKDLYAKSYNIVIGSELAMSMFGTTQIEEMRERGENSVTVIIPQAVVTAAGVIPRFRRFNVVGVFEVGMHEYDSALAMMYVGDAARLYRLGDKVSGIRLKLDDIFAAPMIARELVEKLPGGYMVQDWGQKHSNLFKAINLEKRMMFIILSLIVAVAAFNIVSTLVMAVTDKESDIAILRTLGANPGTIMGIFIIQGAFLGVIGTSLGVLTGIPTALNVETVVSTLESLLGMKFLSPDVYYISELSADLHWDDVIIIGLSSLLVTLLATLYPAWRASRTQPAEALRYE